MQGTHVKPFNLIAPSIRNDVVSRTELSSRLRDVGRLDVLVGSVTVENDLIEFARILRPQ